MKKFKALTLLIIILLSFSACSLLAETKLTRKSIKELIVYTNPRCGYCQRLEAFLKAEKIPFTRKDVTSNQSAYQEFKKLGGTGTPLSILKTRSGDKRISGYDQAEFKKIAAAYKK